MGSLILAGAREWGRLAGWSTAGVSAFMTLVAASGAILLWFGLREPAGARVVATVSTGALVFWLFAALPWLARLRHVRGHLPMAMAGWWVLVPAWVAGAWLQARPWLLLALLAVVWISDTCAYFAGRAFGRHKLVPAISPGKTWEGVGGAVLGVLAFLLVLGLARPPGLPGLLTAGAAGAFLGLTALGILGDLFESWIKRSAGVKDSGTLLPGHGGVLDRIDALTASLPLAALAALTIFAR
jgi:phosphatidate cytidylyltransferase